MAWVVFSKYVENLLDGTATNPNIDTGGDTINIAFLTNTLAPDATHDGNEFFSDIVANEVSTAGTYATRGQATAGQVVSMADGTLTFDIATDEVFLQDAGGFANARYAILMEDTGVDATCSLIAYADLGADKSVVGGDLTIEFDAAGVFTIALAT